MTVCVDDVLYAGLFLEIEKSSTWENPAPRRGHTWTASPRSLGVAVERVADTCDSLVRAALATV
jgi:hypothetical protein